MSFLLQRITPVPGADASVVGAQDRGFLLGDGVFDTLVAVTGKPFALEAHLARLVRAAAVIGIEIGMPALEREIEALLVAVAGRDAIIRTTVTRGHATRGLWPGEPPVPTIAVSAQPWSRTLIGQPAHLCVNEIPRNQRSPLARIKALAYLDNILAARQASQEGCDDALILNLDGNVACSTIANVFSLKGNALVTPPVSEGCLDGIVRRILIEEAPTLGLTPVEAPLAVADILAGDGCFLTNSVRLIRPVAGIGATVLPASPRIAALLDALLARIRCESGATIAREAISPAFSRYLP